VPFSKHHHTACRQDEGDAFCDAAANSCGGLQPESGGSPAHGTPAQSPAEREPLASRRGSQHPCSSNDEWSRHGRCQHPTNRSSLHSHIDRVTGCANVSIVMLCQLSLRMCQLLVDCVKQSEGCVNVSLHSHIVPSHSAFKSPLLSSAHACAPGRSQI